MAHAHPRWLLEANLLPLALSICLGLAHASAARAQDAERDEAPRYWASGEYLLHWVKDGPLSDSLLTVDDPRATSPGAPEPNPPGDEVAVGDSDLDYGAFSGGRITLGGWLDAKRAWGLEGSGFFLVDQEASFSAASSGGTPYLGVPLSINGVAQSIPLSFTDLFGDGPMDGSFNLDSTSEVWGAEANCLRNLDRGPKTSWDLLVGFRHLDLDEEVDLHYFSAQPALPFSAFAQDRFSTETQFFGAQVGSRFQYDEGPWSVNLLGKVALGANRSTVSIAGNGGVFEPAEPSYPAQTPYGVFALPGNIGSHSDTGLAAVAEAKIAFGFQATRHLRFTVGYDFLYWSDVARPGRQIETAVVSPGTFEPGFAGALDDYLRDIAPGATTRAGEDVKESGFWTQGVDFAVEWSF